MSRPVGKVTHLKASRYGVRFRAEIAESDPHYRAAEDAWHRIKSGLLHSLSMGARRIDTEYENGIRRWHKWTMTELSLCMNPCNPEAKIDGLPLDYRPRHSVALLTIPGSAVKLIRGICDNKQKPPVTLGHAHDF